jgi:hypothetical protein
MINLRLHDAGDLSVPLRAAPDLALGPYRQLSQLTHCRVVVALDLIGKRQVRWVKYAWFAPKEAQQACRLFDHQARV